MKKQTGSKEDIRKLLVAHSRRLQKLKEQQAIYGLSVDPRVLLEIEDIEAIIAKLEAALLADTEPSTQLTVFEVDAFLPDITINRSVLVELLGQSFSEEGLKDLCFAHFPDVHDNFSSGSGKNVLIRLLVDFCDRQGLVKELIPLIKAHNPYQFAAYVKKLYGISP